MAKRKPACRGHPDSDAPGKNRTSVGVAETAPIYMSLHIILAPDIAPFRNVTSAITATPATANGISERSSALSASRS